METQTKFRQTLLGRAAIISAVGTTLLMIYVNLAVGLIGGGPNPGNLMYIGVVVVVLIGMILSRFRPVGMERTLYAAVISLVLVAAIALIARMHEYPGSSVTEIVGVNGFFATLFFVSGLLFRFAKEQPGPH